MSTGNASHSCSLANFRARATVFNEGLNDTLFIAAMYSGNPSVIEYVGEISSIISFSTKWGCSHENKNCSS